LDALVVLLGNLARAPETSGEFISTFLLELPRNPDSTPSRLCFAKLPVHLLWSSRRDRVADCNSIYLVLKHPLRRRSPSAGFKQTISSA